MHLLKVGKISKHAVDNLDIPGSKSYSLRALFISELSKQPVILNNILDSDDTSAMQKALKDLRDSKSDIYVNESGITARFITALACISPGAQTIYGKPSLNSRPIRDLVDGLRQLGAEIEYLEKDGCLPIKVSSDCLLKSNLKINGSTSSQYLSALLLVAPLLKNGLVIEVDDEQTSKPYIDMTIDIMSKFGVEVENDNYKKYVVKPQSYGSDEYTVETDYSSASYFFAAAALNKSRVEISWLSQDSKQADKNFLKVLEQFGADIELDKNSVVVTGKELRPITVNMNNCPDQAMTAAVLASFTPGRTIIKGISSLRLKETERIEALQNELAKMGINTRSKKDSLTIFGGKPKAARIDTYNDHRIAMSFAIAGTKLDGIEIINPEVVSKTFPSFWEELSKVSTIKILERDYTNVLLIGMRGTGKSTTGKLLARKLNKKFIDMDKHIEDKEKKKIREIVLENGWDYFRQLEHSAAAEISKLSGYVIASGGGIVLNPKNIEYFKQNSIVVLINANPRILTKRIRKDKNRLGLTEQPTLLGELSEVWKERRNLYFSACDFVVKSDRSSSKKVTQQIIDKIDR
ncbi:3-phosphoshikimate 1-carboxyvinyltransferase [Candidatus Saccharibacteria bacterium]|nr:3-phosphoshikimate 1-carboxyvinyltransferase [Candidatus Saccharibacteria bacterium]